MGGTDPGSDMQNAGFRPPMRMSESIPQYPKKLDTVFPYC
jgi:hypothetical protein